MRKLAFLVLVAFVAGCGGSLPPPKNATKCPSYGGNTNDKCTQN